MNTIIVGIAGLAGAGKDTFAEMLIEELKKANVSVGTYAFALPVKHVASYVFGLDDKDVNTQAGKKAVSKHGYSLTHREILQKVGTESFRDVFNDQIWIDFAKRSMEDREEVFTIITDLRFPNELQFVKDNGISVRIDAKERNNIVVPDHPSERFVQNMPVDIVINNDGSLADLKKLAAEVAEVLLTPLSNSLEEELFGVSNGVNYDPAS